jgi:exopolysaccharide production protein ExoZ
MTPRPDATARAQTPTAPDRGTREQLDTVQALRAVAALSVVGMHIPAIEHGAFGVDLFFVISGFIVCHVTAADPGRFLIKRVIRVVPLYWLCTLALFALATAVPSLMGATRADPGELVKSLAFVPFMKSNGQVHPLLYLGWTLNYEMMFYVLFALSLLIAPRRPHVPALALVLALFTLGRVTTFQSVQLTFWTGAVVIEFAFGIVAYRIWRSGALRRLHPAWAATLAVVAWAVMAPQDVDPLSDARPWLWGVPALAAFMAVLSLEGRWRVPTLWLLIGNASYSLYLTHAYILQAIQKKVLPMDAFTAPKLLWMAMSVALCCAVAVGCFRLIERPSTLWLRRHLLQRRGVRGEALPAGDAINRA